MKRRRLLLVGNYAPDRQESMARFAHLLAAAGDRLEAEPSLLLPAPHWARLAPRYQLSGYAKWLGYLDKFLWFPRTLRRTTAALAASGTPALVHICDHSNAMYGAHVRGLPWCVTAHDLLAVRGALGEDTDCPASGMGVRLQRWILRSLAAAPLVACVSDYTRSDLLRLVPEKAPDSVRVVHNGLNFAYAPLPAAECDRRLAAAGLGHLPRPFILHVGSNLARKNKSILLRALALAGARCTADLVFAGPPLTPALRDEARALGVAARIHEAVKPPNDALAALYCTAQAFAFPSRWEGFGWPVVEAHASDCPVISSDQSSLPEVAGDAALLCPPDDAAAWAEAFVRVGDPAVRAALIQRGRLNVTRFTPERMLDGYRALHDELLATARSRPAGTPARTAA